jgi:hypothetical protein
MNGSETIIKQMLEQRGFRVLRNGWPDFLCIKDTLGPLRNYQDWNGQPVARAEKIKGICAVEVKSGSDKLSDEQKAVHQALAAVRLPVYVVRPDGDIANLKVRRFLTYAEIKNAASHAEEAKQKLLQLRKDAAKLEQYLDELNTAIEATSAICQSAEPLIEESIPADPINEIVYAAMHNLDRAISTELAAKAQAQSP